MSEIGNLIHTELSQALSHGEIDWVKVKEILVEILDVLTKVSTLMPTSLSKEIVVGILTLLGLCISYLPEPPPPAKKN